MRHQKRVKKIGHNASHKKAILKNLIRSLILHGKLMTTHTKAKEAQRLIERLITYGKKGDVHNRRLAYRYLQDRELVRILFDEIAPQYSGRNGGYTRVLHLGRRENDAAPVSVLEFVDYTPASESKKKKTEKKVKDKKKAVKENTQVEKSEDKSE